MKNPLCFGRFMVLALALFHTSCNQQSNNNSQVQHNRNEPVRDESFTNWTTLTSNEFNQFALHWNGIDNSIIFSDEHQLTKRVQFWIDLIDTKLRLDHSEAMKHIPKPMAKIIKHKSTNAFVTPVVSCLTLPVVNTATDLEDGVDLPAILLDQSSGNIFTADQESVQRMCGPLKDKKALQQIVDKFNKLGNECIINYSNDRITLSSNNCKAIHDKNKKEYKIKSANKIAVLQIANGITLFSGLFTQLKSEKEFVGILAHELGHYYRAHPLATKDLYNYFYRVDAENSERTPTPDSSLNTLGEQAIKASIAAQTKAFFAGQSSDWLSPYYFLASGSIIKDVCANQECDQSCKNVLQIQTNEEFTTALAYYPISIFLGDKSIYNIYSEKTRACLSTLKFGQNNDVNMTQLTWAILNPSWMQAELAEIIPYVMALVHGRTTFGDFSHLSLDKVFEKLSSEAKYLDLMMDQILATAYNERLGYYTTEQEADDLSTEITHLIGVGAQSTFDGMMSLAADNEASEFEVGYENCKTLADNNWETLEGEAVFIPIGNYADPHHSACYRAYNISREIKAHNYSHNGDLSMAPKLEWTSIQDLAQSLPGVPVNPFVTSNENSSLLRRLSFDKNCPLSNFR